MFGRATIRLGIGPHSSYFSFQLFPSIPLYDTKTVYVTPRTRTPLVPSPCLNVLDAVSRAPGPTNPPVSNWECWLTDWHI